MNSNIQNVGLLISYGTGRKQLEHKCRYDSGLKCIPKNGKTRNQQCSSLRPISFSCFSHGLKKCHKKLVRNKVIFVYYDRLKGYQFLRKMAKEKDRSSLNMGDI